MISVWSVLSASLWFSVACLLLMLLRKHTNFLLRYGTAAWSAAILLTVVRLLLPLDLEYMIVLRSYRVLPVLREAMEYELTAGLTVKRLLAWLWLGGTLVWLGCVVFGMIRDDRNLGRAIKAPRSRQLKEAAERCGIPVGMIHVTPAITTPVSMGYIHPAIYLPDRPYVEGDLDLILKHEMTHLAGHDPWLCLGFLLFRCVFWWNPLVHLAQTAVREVLELRCDKTVLAGVEESERLAYVEALCRAGHQTYPGAPRFVGVGTFFAQPGETVTLALRAKMAMDAPAKRDKTALAALALSVALFVVSYVFIPQPAGFFPSAQDDAPPVYGVSPDTSYLKKLPSGEYEFWCDGELVWTISEDMLQDEMFKDLEVVS